MGIERGTPKPLMVFDFDIRTKCCYEGLAAKSVYVAV